MRYTIKKEMLYKIFIKKCIYFLAIVGLFFLPSYVFAAELTNPLGSNDIRAIIGNAIKAVLGITGSLALLMFVWGGLLWMTARGEEAHIKQGRETMIWAGLGLVVIFGSYAIVRFVLETLLKQ